MFRTTENKMFDSRSPEYALVDSMAQEKFTNYSPEVYWWSFIRDKEPNAPYRDELDQIYGEKSSTGSERYLGPYEVKLVVELNPILAELTRLGLQQIEEIEIYCNIAAMSQYLKGLVPKAGDILRVSYIVTEFERRFVFYKVSNITPVDPFNYKFINWHISAEQTTLHEAPESIKDFAISNG